MPITNIHKMIPLSSLGVIITGKSFSYVVTASEGNFSLSLHLAMQIVGPGWALPSWFKINKRGIAIRMPRYTFFKKILVGRTSIPDRRVPIQGCKWGVSGSHTPK